jgi:succinate dehydrogenase/fumarate reductase flavoprotein subunit
MMGDASPRHVLVCGAGLAGLSAAVSAQEHGARVTVCEKAPVPGGTTLLSGGLLWTFADYEEIRRRIPFGDGALQWLVLETIDASREWLKDFGVRMGPIRHVLDHGLGSDFEPEQAIGLLVDRLCRYGGALRLGCGLESLLTLQGRVRGARVVNEGVCEEIAADAVVLATGGFQGNAELLARYVLRGPGRLALRANAWSTGDGFLAATDAGAAVSAGLHTFYGHPLIAPPGRYMPHALREASMYHGALSVALNLDGVRFADETEPTGDEALNQHLAQQPFGLAAFVVDDHAMDTPALQGLDLITRTLLQRARAARGHVAEAASLEQLCDAMAAMGLPPRRALASLHEFNSHMAEGKADDLRPARSRHRVPLMRPPFHAVLVQAGITATMGGLLVDEKLRVLRRAGTSSIFADTPTERAFAEPAGCVLSIGERYRQTWLDGLHAAGGDVGNVSHFGYAGGLATALTTGRAAGRSAAIA